METIAYNATAIGFVVLTIVMYTLVLLELRKALSRTPWDDNRKRKIFNRVIFFLSAWTVFISVLGISGFLQEFKSFPPRLMVVLVIPLITMIVVTYSKTTRALLEFVPAKTLVRLQVFRVFVEILLWSLFIQNILPVQMSFEGRNFDVLSGITAPFVAYFLINNKVALVVWNILCLGLLINIVTIAMLSLPSPLRVFMNEPANTIVTFFPFVWLPGLLVPLAYGLHFLSLRHLSVANNKELLTE